jgi:hypothetical protein
VSIGVLADERGSAERARDWMPETVGAMSRRTWRRVMGATTPCSQQICRPEAVALTTM